MLRHTLGLLTVGGLLICSGPASAGPFGNGGPFGGNGPFSGLFGKKQAGACAPACATPAPACGQQAYGQQRYGVVTDYVTVAVPNQQVQQVGYAAPASDCGCSSASYAAPMQSQPVYSQPSYSQPSYSQPTMSAPMDSGCSTCGSAPVLSYSQPQTSYTVADSGCGTTSTCGTPACGSVVSSGTTQGYATQNYGQSYAATQTYGSGIVQTSGSDCGCSGSGVVSSGMTTSNYAPQQSVQNYGQPMGQSYGQPMGQSYNSGTVISGNSGCSTCSQGTVADGTQNFGAPVPDQGMQNGTVNYGETLQQGGFINEQPLESTQGNAVETPAAPADDEA